MKNEENFYELQLQDYLHIIGRRKWIGITFYFIVVAIVTVATIMMQPQYKATATLFIDIESPNVLTASGSVALQSQNYYAYKEYFQTQKEVITSNAILKRVFNEFRLGDTPEFKKAKQPLEKFRSMIKVEPINETRLMTLSVTYKDPEIAAKIANRIAQIYVKQNLFFISRNELMNLLKNEYLKLQTKLSEYEKIYKAKHPKMIRLKKEISDMTKKIEALKRSDGNFDDYLEKLHDDYQITLANLKPNNVRILNEAIPPAYPSSPKKALNLAIACIVGFFGGIGLIFFVEYMDDTLQGVKDLKRLVPWKILGSVPYIDKIGYRRRALTAELFPRHPAAEGYRAIRTALIYSNEENLNSFTVTSTCPQEGKTTTTCNLSLLFAHNDKKTVLIDADMRKPQIHRIFKIKNQKGLSDYLSGKSSYEEIIHKTDINNLFIIPSGKITDNASELLSGNKMKELFEKLRNEFDMIIFDTPPVPVVTDAIILGKLTNGLCLVVQKAVTSRGTLKHITQILNDAKVNVLGVIMNRSPITAGSSSYSYYYGKK